MLRIRKHLLAGIISVIIGVAFACGGSSAQGDCVEQDIYMYLGPGLALRSGTSYTSLGTMTHKECIDLCNQRQQYCEWHRQASLVEP